MDKKVFENKKCGLCEVEEGSLERVWNCVEAHKGIKKQWEEGVDRWKGGGPM